MRKLKQYTFKKKVLQTWGWKKFDTYFCDNGEGKMVGKSSKEVLKLIKENRINLTIQQFHHLPYSI